MRYTIIISLISSYSTTIDPHRALYCGDHGRGLIFFHILILVSSWLLVSVFLVSISCFTLTVPLPCVFLSDSSH